MRPEDEERSLQSVALANAQSILKARQRAEEALIQAKGALERQAGELAHSLSLVRATLESTADGILATDLSGRVTEFNTRFSAMWGIPPGKLRAAGADQVFASLARQLQDPTSFLETVHGILSTTSTSAEGPKELELTDGRVIEQFTRIQEIDDRDVGRVWSYRDITERVRMAAALRDAKDAAEGANRAKSEFLAMMSHELRTPLNAIGGYVELIAMGIRGPVTEEQREDLLRIQKSQRHLLGLINEVLNYARIETGTLQYELSDVRLQDALASAEGLIAPQVWKKGLQLTTRKGSHDFWVKADPEKLQQILLNLLSNAVKFTAEGGRIAVTCTADGDQVTLSVRDTGSGIPEDKLGSIFEPFVQVRSDLTRTTEGAGLGLAISRDLARGMGGDLSVESVPGEGSTFMLRLPARTPR